MLGERLATNPEEFAGFLKNFRRQLLAGLACDARAIDEKIAIRAARDLSRAIGHNLQSTPDVDSNDTRAKLR